MPHVDPITVTALGAVFTTVSTMIGAAFAWSLARNIRAMDESVKALVSETKAHASDIGNLRERVAVIEDRERRRG